MKLLMTLIASAVLTIFPSDIESLVTSNELVNSPECIVYADTVIVALRTEPIFFRSERLKLTEDLKAGIKERYDVREIIITFDKDIYYKITKIDAERAKGVAEEKIRNDIISLIETVRYRGDLI